MVDKTVLQRKMTALEEYLEDLADSRTLSLNEFLKDKMKRRFIDETLMGKLKRMAQFRNILVHDHTRVQPEIVYSALMKDSLDMEVFTECIVKYESN